jgi:branched-chain amino acid transport system substrate-binding protein
MNKTSKIIIGIIVAIIVIGGIWYGVSKKAIKVEKKEPVKILFIGPLTGNAATGIGIPHQRGFMMGIEDMKNKGINVDAIFEDDQGDKTKAVTIAQQLIATDKNVKILVSPLSGVSFALAPIAQENNIILFSTGANPAIAKINENTFRFFINADRQGKIMADYAKNNLNLKSAAILYINDEFGISERDAIKREFEARGINITKEESYEVGASDVKTQVTKILATNPEAIIFSGYGSGLVTAIKTVREFGYNGIYLSDLNAAYPPLSTDLINLTEGMYITDFNFDIGDPKIKEFTDKFRNRFGVDRVYPNSALEYAVAEILGEVVKECGENVECIKNKILSSKFNILLGEVVFNEEGDASSPVILKHIVNGKEIIVKK